MSLPPDPHDDDLAEPPTPPPAAAGTNDAPAPPPPPPPPAASPGAPPPPSSPAYPQPFEAAPAPTTVPTAPASDPNGSATVASPPTVAGAATDGDDATARLDSGAPAGTSGGRSRLGLALAGVVAVIVIAAGVVLATGSSDGGDTDEVASDSSAAGEAAPEAGAGDSEDPSAADDAPDSEADSAAPGDETDGDGAPAGEGDPVAVAEEFFEAVSSGDCEGMVSRMTMDSFGADGQAPEEAIVECESDTVGTAGWMGPWEDVRLISMDGDEATIGVTLTVGGRETERALPIVLDDGEWKMDLDIAAGPGR